ncbi:hypothetical protein GQ602_003200 [Ophiocordyceps camponoti-floridani]|uniref:Uncharacterized protein n=1 Tax=Ophiocordyceps camponoti-floridani TaxID=2030778 RepID=A0A8H4Q7R2_9HYPO|nr:hypothetical protein GQ602_003200 [Ophiocordyceps camponoti-floridani]
MTPSMASPISIGLLRVVVVVVVVVVVAFFFLFHDCNSSPSSSCARCALRDSVRRLQGFWSRAASAAAPCLIPATATATATVTAPASPRPDWLPLHAPLALPTCRIEASALGRGETATKPHGITQLQPRPAGAPADQQSRFTESPLTTIRLWLVTWLAHLHYTPVYAGCPPFSPPHAVTEDGLALDGLALVSYPPRSAAPCRLPVIHAISALACSGS